MDCSSGNDFAGRHEVEFQSGNLGNVVNDNWHLGSINQTAWAAKDGMCNKETSQSDSKPYHEGRPFQFEVGNETPNGRADHSLLVDLAASDSTEAIENMFYKTKLCHRFRDGTCPYISDCKFAHSAEELRKLPRNWKETVSVHKLQEMEFSEPREVVQIPLVGFDDVAEPEGPNVRQTRSYCKDFLSGLGYVYGDNCAYIHRGHNKQRQSVAICLLPGNAGGHESSESKLFSNAPFRKTRLCSKWESTGFCAYGGICRFAHGLAELQPIGGGLVGREAEDSSTVHANQVAVPTQAPVNAVVGPVPAPAPTPAPAPAPAPSLVPYSYRVGAPSRTLPNVKQNTGDIPIRKWKGPNKISKIYGDWIDDL